MSIEKIISSFNFIVQIIGVSAAVGWGFAIGVLTVWKYVKWLSKP
jgi:hypothetical protein